MSAKRVLISSVLVLLCEGALARIPSVQPSGSAAASPPAIEPSPVLPSADNPYTSIVTRNGFHLVPKPEPPPAPPVDPMANATVKITGLIRIAGEKPRALFACSAKDAKNTTYYNLTEGEHDGNFELVRILPDEEGAEVIQAGNHLTVLLKDSKPVVTASAPAPAGGPVPGGAPAPANAPAPMGTVISAPSYAPSLPGRGVVMAGGADPGGSIPSRQVRTPENVPSLDEVHVMMAADTILHQDEIAHGEYPPPLPPIKNIVEGREPDDDGTEPQQMPPGMQMPGMPQ